jgi:hypothetical protein
MDASLFARYRFGAPVVLHSDEIRNADLQAFAEFWAEKRDKAIDAMDELVAALHGPAEQWDEAVIGFEIKAQMPQLGLELNETRALQLLRELQAALDFNRAAKGQGPIPFPHQQDRRDEQDERPAA